MSLFDFFSSESPESVGQKVLSAYFDEASKFPEFTHASYESWIDWLNARVPDFVAMIGDLVIMNKASTSIDMAVQRAQSLANSSGGQANIPSIVQAAGGSGDTVNWAEGIPEIATETVKELGTQVQNIGSSTLAVAKYLPYIAVGLGVLYVFTLAGGPMRIFKK